MGPDIKYGLIHCHTENSLKDSALTPTRLVERAKELGAPAVTITDHGTLTGVFEFINAAEKQGDIKAIPGVEAYVEEDSDLKRSHLLLLAKDYTGYKAISKATTKSNTRMKNGKPRYNMAIIEEFFGEGSIGHDHVIATSACVAGVLASILLCNQTIQKEIEKQKRRAEKFDNPNSTIYQENKKLLLEYGKEVEELMARRDTLKVLADKKYAMRERAIAKMTGAEKEKAETELAADKEASQLASDELATIKTALAQTKKRETVTRQACKKSEESHAKWYEVNSEIETLTKGIISDKELYEKAKAFAEKYRDIFGDGNFYIELQNHGIEEEAFVMPLLAKMAKELGISTVACNDVHFENNTVECVRARKILAALRDEKWHEDRADDAEYYIKTDAELTQWLGKILDAEAVDNAMHGIESIVKACNVEFPHDTHYPAFCGNEDGEDSEQRLRRLTEEGIQKRYPNGLPEGHRERIEYELKIINEMHYTDYLCIVQDYVRYGRERGLDCPEGVGYAIGPGRGSAAGSLVCYLIGITSVDPMLYGLLFERFLNPERVTSPDIDVDFSMEVRGDVLEYVKSKYGNEAVCCITTKGTLAAKAAIKAAARTLSLERHGTEGLYMDLGNVLAKIIPNEPKATIAKNIDELRAALPDNEAAQQIISDAEIIEGTAVNYGMHAAGVIIADNGDVKEYIPLLWNSKNERWCSQCDMGEAEKSAGLLKFDFLGLKNLDIISKTLRAIKKNTGISIDIEAIPQESAVYKEIFAKGNTNFIFQFESDGMKKLLRDYNPEKLEDLILLNALFRPGPLQHAQAICDTKSGKKKPSYICEAAKEILESTYSYPVYQEQVMQLCNKVAGFTLGEADLIRRYMSKKKEKEMAKYKPKFVNGLIKSGATPENAEAFWEQLTEFAKYAFNKSHAAVYAMIAYYTGWLKYHYPTEYMSAIMNHTPFEKLPRVVVECRSLGIKILPPDINKSEETFSGKNSTILFGLGGVKSLGNSATAFIEERKTNGEFRSFKDLLTRTLPNQKAYESLVNAGAFDLWCTNRAAMISVAPNLLDDIKKVNKKKELLETETDEKKRAKLEQAMQEYQERIDQTIIPISIVENQEAKLAAEKDLIGMYVSGHPIDEYPLAKEKRTMPIALADSDGVYVTLSGIVRELRQTKRKSDGAAMSFFKLEDETADIDVCCFAKKNKEYGHLIEEDAVLSIEGKLNIDIDEESETERRQLFVDSIVVIPPRQHSILITVYGIPKWTDEVYPALVPYSSENGRRVILYDSAIGEYRETTLRLSTDVLDEDIEGVEISEVDM